MKFDGSKKLAILNYTLEKIQQNEPHLSKRVSEAFGINQNTVHSYISEAIERNIITRTGRGKYTLVKQEYEYSLKRSNGDLRNDTYAYDVCMPQHLSGFQRNVVEIWEYAFSEMINNVMDHSGAENVLIRISQDYLNTTVYILDDGVGIFNKIKNHFDLPTLDEAICELFKGKLTTDSRNHSGEGIFFSSKLMDEFFILSSQKIFTCNKYDDSDIREFPKASDGTLVMMRLANHTNKHSKEIFDMYGNEDGEFVKTRLPLKNVFPSSPVSRSQAKRICNRIDKFEEIILDFDGVEWMGQGFAHQIFVVFQNQHPEIRLMPINMNDSINKMYNHVLHSNTQN